MASYVFHVAQTFLMPLAEDGLFVQIPNPVIYYLTYYEPVHPVDAQEVHVPACKPIPGILTK